MTKQEDFKSEQRERDSQQLQRKRYLKPELTHYGHIKVLTQSGTGATRESSNLKAFRPS